MKVLGIETSCDETAVALVEDGRTILSNVVASQVEMHARYGGIVPEVASRQHLLSMSPTVSEALKRASATLDQVDALAVTYGPGLAGSLLVGVNFAKALAFSRNMPLIGVNHLEGHIYAVCLEGKELDKSPGFPLVCLIASGGHTDLVLMKGHGQYVLLGRTRDDAAGEAFDKAARVLGLGFPGGPAIQKAARPSSRGQPLPRPKVKDSLDFSFSGLKTALIRRAQGSSLYPAPESGQRDPELVAEIAASFQDSMADVLVERTLEAAEIHKAAGVLLGGGVAANALLRQQMAARSPIPVLMPSPGLCTDNGAMIAAAGYRLLKAGLRSGWDLDVIPNLSL